MYLYSSITITILSCFFLFQTHVIAILHQAYQCNYLLGWIKDAQFFVSVIRPWVILITCFFGDTYSIYHMASRLSVLLHHGNIELIVLVMRPLRSTKEVKTQHSLLYTRLEIKTAFDEISLDSSLHFRIKKQLKTMSSYIRYCSKCVTPASFYHEYVKIRVSKRNMNPAYIYIFLSLKLVSYDVSQ